MLNSSKKLLALYFLVHVDDFEIKRAGLRILKRERLDLFLKRSFFHYQPLSYDDNNRQSYWWQIIVYGTLFGNE